MRSNAIYLQDKKGFVRGFCALKCNLFTRQKGFCALKCNLFTRQKRFCALKCCLFTRQKGFCALKCNLRKGVCALKCNLFTRQKEFCALKCNLLFVRKVLNVHGGFKCQQRKIKNANFPKLKKLSSNSYCCPYFANIKGTVSRARLGSHKWIDLGLVFFRFLRIYRAINIFLPVNTSLNWFNHKWSISVH